jgi:hypothetical protein
MEKQIVAALVLLTLSGAVPSYAMSQPVQIGLDKYEIEYGFFDTRRDVLAGANHFCRAKGFVWMEESSDYSPGTLTFFCMRPGDHVVGDDRRDPPVLVLPLH